MTVRLAKMTSKNQLTVPVWAVRALGHPTHFRVQVCEGVLLLWPGKIVCAADKPQAPDGRQDSRGGRGK
jgi:hypothetical protein